MKIYLDAEYLCHAENAGGYTEYETDIFEGRGRHYIECFRLVPEGKRWTRADGAVFDGFMLAQAKPDVYEVLELEKLEELAIANSDMLIDILLEKAERELGL